MKKTDEQKIISAYKRYYKQLVNYAYFRVNDYSLAEELVQDSFLKTWIYMNTPRSKILDYKNFLYRVLKNHVIDFYKQNNKHILSIEQVNQKSLFNENRLDEIIDNRIKYESLIKAINELEKKYKDVLIYRYLQGLNIQTICNITGMSPNYVSVLTYKALKILKEGIEKESFNK